MLRRIRSRLTLANVMASVAVEPTGCLQISARGTRVLRTIDQEVENAEGFERNRFRA